MADGGDGPARVPAMAGRQLYNPAHKKGPMRRTGAAELWVIDLGRNIIFYELVQAPSLALDISWAPLQACFEPTKQAFDFTHPIWPKDTWMRNKLVIARAQKNGNETDMWSPGWSH